MKQLTPREKTLAWLVGGSVAFLLNIFVLRYFFDTQAQLRRDFAQKEGQLAGMRTLLANTALWEERDAWLRAKQPRLENEATGGVQLLSQVQELAKKHGVAIEQPAIANPERRPQHTAVLVNVETKSTWKSLVQFLAALQGPEQFIVLESANLRIDPTDQTQMRGHFRIAKWFAPR